MSLHPERVEDAVDVLASIDRDGQAFVDLQIPADHPKLPFRSVGLTAEEAREVADWLCKAADRVDAMSGDGDGYSHELVNDEVEMTTSEDES